MVYGLWCCDCPWVLCLRRGGGGGEHTAMCSILDVSAPWAGAPAARARATPGAPPAAHARRPAAGVQTRGFGVGVGARAGGARRERPEKDGFADAIMDLSHSLIY